MLNVLEQTQYSELEPAAARDHSRGRSPDADHPLGTIPTQRRATAARSLKRVLDVCGALCGLLLLSPLLAAAALAVRFSGRGPVFFRQQRVGESGRLFYMYKFRTMVVDAEKRLAELAAQNEKSGPIFKIKNDPRITPVGRFLRRHSIDELPQLINVLRGDMSLVGPRPPLLREVMAYQPWQLRRLSVVPGLTCIWQTSGRSDISFKQWVQMDLDYIDHWSLTLDVLLIIKTVSCVLFPRGAY